MHLALGKIREEIIRLLPAVIFFFVAFNLIVLTEDLSDEPYGVRAFRYAGAAIGALLVAKVVLVVECLPFANVFSGRPLIYSAAWKTMIYVLAALVFVYLEHLIPLLFKHYDLIAAHRHLASEIVWPRFMAILIWLIVLFFLFAAGQELSRMVGRQQLRHMFIGR